ncbi:Dehydrogenase azaJ [Psilocybe cubensis]|uniref:Enoyl reductase (ER) domain-containing protein n=2 Tax=Psilocybe cubensis TaxID=181762 RepID=A0A8H8CH64_PSICU|nr:Dehydrogenase azaJ [Psilocybe cubensis]KAH9477838.1 Dehydrogenase azaJ [Psilocybe cubensis]
MSSSSAQTQHLAAILTSKGSPFDIAYRTTPTPGPDEVLVEVKAIAINPIDAYQRLSGFVIDSYPAVIGSDVGGVIIAAGINVSTDLQPGTRVSAFAPCFFRRGAPDYGAFQERVLIPASNVALLPEKISFKEASLFPMAVGTAWAGLQVVGIPRDAEYKQEDKKVLLIWGGASSIGSAVIQVAKSLGFITYVTASENHHDYMKELGADKVFDYKAEDTVDAIVKSAREDGVKIQYAYEASGRAVKDAFEVLKKAKGKDIAKLASAAPLRPDCPTAEGIEVKFVAVPTDVGARREFSSFVYRDWLTKKLADGEFVPSPRIKVVGKGLESLQKGLDEWSQGVSGVKLVVDLEVNNAYEHS